jgi:lysophosphatidylcholine acyltransferase/lyso-PAF acetyltransferase
MLGGFGILTRGKRATRKEAPILVCAPHSTFFDALLIFFGEMGSPLARDEEQRFGSKLIVHV